MVRLICVSILLVALLGAGRATGGDRDRYRYVLRESLQDGVCRHMQSVYNQNFAHPWRRPPLTKLVDDPEYGATSSFAFPKRPGVVHDSKMTFDMSYSRRPTSQEFDAVNWQEVRIDRGSPVGETAALLAELDIDNDGRQDLIIKSGFMRAYHSSNGSGGQDYLYVFLDSQRELPNPIPGDMLLTNEGGGGPAAITASPTSPYRLLRPFRYEGVTYLSGYRRTIKGKEMHESIHILKYRGGGHLVRAGERTPVRLEKICSLDMNAK